MFYFLKRNKWHKKYYKHLEDICRGSVKIGIVPNYITHDETTAQIFLDEKGYLIQNTE